MVVCQNFHISFTKFIYLDFIVLKLMETFHEAYDQYFAKLETQMECSECGNYRENKVTIQKQFLTFPEILLVKIDRVDDDGRVTQTKMQITEEFKVEDKS